MIGNGYFRDMSWTNFSLKSAEPEKKETIMSTDLARELDYRYRTRFANDDAAKTLNPPKVEGAGTDVKPLAMPPAKDVGPGIHYVVWKNELGEVKKVRVAAENEEAAIQQSKKQLRGSGWTVLRVDRP